MAASDSGSRTPTDGRAWISRTTASRSWRAFRSDPPVAGRAGRVVSEARRIPVRKEDLWTFTQRNVPLWDVLDFFPSDAVGPRGPGDAPRPYAVQPITIETDLG